MTQYFKYIRFYVIEWHAIKLASLQIYSKQAQLLALQMLIITANSGNSENTHARNIGQTLYSIITHSGHFMDIFECTSQPFYWHIMKLLNIISKCKLDMVAHIQNSST